MIKRIPFFGLLLLLAIFISALSALTAGAVNARVDPDIKRPDKILDIETKKATTKGWDVYFLDNGQPWTNAAALNYTGTLYYADSWTAATFTVAIESDSVISNVASFAPTREHTATAGVFVCEITMDNGSDLFTAASGSLEIEPSISGNDLVLLALTSATNSIIGLEARTLVLEDQTNGWNNANTLAATALQAPDMTNGTAGGALGEGAFVNGQGGAVGYGAETVQGGSVGMNSSSGNGGAVGTGATSTDDGGAIGYEAIASGGGAIGYRARAGIGFAGGYEAFATDDGTHDGAGIDAVQLGPGGNTAANTLQVYTFQMMNADGTIPLARFSGVVTNGGAATLTGATVNGTNLISTTEAAATYQEKDADLTKLALNDGGSLTNIAAATSRYIVETDNGKETYVKATGTGITGNWSGTGLTLTIPAGSVLHAVRVNWDAMTYGTTFTIDVGTNDMINLGFTTRWPCAVAGYRQDTGAYLATAQGALVVGTHSQMTISGLQPGVGNTVLLEY